MKDPLINLEIKNPSKNGIEEAIAKYSLKNKDPFLDHSFISNLFFHWGFKLIKLSNITSLKQEYLGKPRDQYSSRAMFENLKHHWNNQKNKKNCLRSLFMTIIRANIWDIVLIVILGVFKHTTRILQVASFHYYLQLFKKNTSVIEHSYTIIEVGVFYLLLRFFEVLLIGKTYEYQCYLGFKGSAELNCLIYDKLLRLSTNDISSQSQTGEILNFIQVDSDKLNRAMLYTQDLISLPYSIIMYSYFLFSYIGVSFLFGIVTLILFILINFQFQKRFKLIQRNCMHLKDQRMKISTETFNILKMLKLYCWENEFKQKIIQSHETELALLKKRFDLANITQTIATIGPIAVSIVSIGAYQYFNDKLNIEDIFSCINVFTSLSGNIRMFPMILSQFYDTSISMQRVEKYLLQKEINYKNIIRNDQETIINNLAIQIENCSFSWKELTNEEISQISVQSEDNKRIKSMKKENSKTISNKFLNSFDFKLRYEELDQGFICLKDINIKISKGIFVIILGEVGSGKSSLLQSLLNRMNVINPKGKVIVNGTVSYVNQIPWIINNTLRNNILFFQKFDEEKYKKILSICQLDHDIEGLIGKDLTEIGEKGTNLSGGQKVRINLARALYTNADIFFLDDITSALDADIAIKIIKKCVLGYLKGKTRLLVTNTIKYASYADSVIYMREGEVIYQGSFEQLKKQKFYENYCSKHSSSNLSLTSEKSLQELDDENSKTKGIKRITKDEIQQDIKLSNQVFKEFSKLIGGCIIIILIGFIMIVLEGFKGASHIWLGYWSNHQSIEKNSEYFMYYSLLGFSEAIFFFIYSKISSSSSIKLSRGLHDSMITSLINAPLASFHDTIPKGQIINRISKDINQIDSSGMSSYTTYLAHSITFVSSIAICSIYQPYSLLFLPLLVAVGLYLTSFYLKSSRELTHLEAIMRSPIVTLATDTINGLDTIREYGIKDKYMEMFHERIDNHLKIRIAKIGTSQWFNLYLDLLSISFFAFLIFITITYRNQYSIEDIGIIMIYFIPIQVNLVRMLYDRTIFEVSMVNIERCLEYTKCLKERAKSLPIDKELIEQSWPSRGHIIFKDFSSKYRQDSEVILKDISLEIQSKEKVGIVGRTGSGKTTLSLCLFRIIEAMKGSIYIDDIDISTIGLDLLRKSITIIPQDPSLVEGSLRYNIDPLNLSTDEEIINIMKRIGFDYLIYNNDKGLDQKLDDSGSNISVGEKQLVCIARAILRKSKIIVLDEATASIDYQTEEIILKAMKELFSDSTVIMIAHRLKTIIHCNKILVINDGKVAEYNTPEMLMRNKAGIYFELYSKSL